MVINKDLIPKIEEAIGFKLYPSQIEALLNDNYIGLGSRRCGRTLVYMIKLAMSEGEPLRRTTRYFSEITDRSSKETHYTDWFIREFLDVHSILKEAGLEVREIIK